jgi:peptidoglycan hydrolase-like protein with peptidoglycan-binding domain
VTGVVDVATWERLVVEVRLGDRGEAVSVLQWLLSFHGFPLVTDGIFGPRTEAATLAFQQKWGVPASGVASLQTWRVAVANVKA